jgi:hypothetical protein
MARPPGALPLLLALALLAAGCTSEGFHAARVPEAFLHDQANNGWRLDQDRSDAAPRSEGPGGLAQRQALVYVDDGTNSPRRYPASLVLTTVRTTPTPSEGQLRDLLRQQVEQRSAEQGIRLGNQTLEGSRTLADGHGTLYFAFTGTVSGEGPLFTTRDATAKIVGEVWNCPGAGSSVLAVGLAQVSASRGVGGIALPPEPDATNWRELVADPRGSIEGHRGNDGLLHQTRCAPA